MKVIAEGLIKRIHINQHNIRKNAKGGGFPVVSVKTSACNHKGNEVEILGPSKVVYSPEKPLSCGAKVWIETRALVKIR